ncbi:MAG: Lrp/AsnC family transcriptional regulator [Pseudomonadota bacterium]
MDKFDRKILRELQANNRQTQDQIAEKSGMSASAVRRRIERLRADGTIIGDVSLIDPARAGVTVITSIRFEHEDRSAYDRFAQLMNDAPEVSQCYMVSGEVEFVVIAHMRDLSHYEEWMATYLLDEPFVQRAHTNIVYKRLKYTTAVPLC